MTDETVLCYSEEPGVAAALVRIARALAPGNGSRVRGVVLPGHASGFADLLVEAGAHSVHTVAGSASPDPHWVASVLASLVAELSPSMILIGSTKRGREVAGRLAGVLDLPATTGATSLRLDGDGLRVEREALSGNAVATERIVRRPAIIAVMPGVTAGAPGPIATCERRDHAAAPTALLSERTDVRPKAGGQLEIEKAERIVTIGRGLRKKEDLALIEALAKALGAEVGCTRPLAAESGWLTDDHWIGLTGHRVHPKLYVAVGVSGAVQHLVGMRSSQVVVAINKDPNAPIFAQADYRITGDLYQVVPALTKALKG
jgi:electron transfer flavoprotein alpha subunit